MWSAFASTLVLAAAATVGMAAPQLLPAPGDGEIRTVYWELQNASDIWLTLEPRTSTGARAPSLTFTHRFPGRRPTAPPTAVEVRAFAGQFWAPRSELWFALDEAFRIDLSVYGHATAESGFDSWAGSMSIAALRRMAQAQRITGNALRFPFELNDSQRNALRTFLDHITGSPRDRARP